VRTSKRAELPLSVTGLGRMLHSGVVDESNPSSEAVLWLHIGFGVGIGG